MFYYWAESRALHSGKLRKTSGLMTRLDQSGNIQVDGIASTQMKMELKSPLHWLDLGQFYDVWGVEFCYCLFTSCVVIILMPCMTPPHHDTVTPVDNPSPSCLHKTWGSHHISISVSMGRIHLISLGKFPELLTPLFSALSGLNWIFPRWQKSPEKS